MVNYSVAVKIEAESSSLDSECCVYLSYRDHETLTQLKNLVSCLVSEEKVASYRCQFRVGIHLKALNHSLEQCALLVLFRPTSQHRHLG